MKNLNLCSKVTDVCVVHSLQDIKGLVDLSNITIVNRLEIELRFETHKDIWFLNG